MILMAYDKQKVIDLALSEVGYLEKASNAQLDDKTANAGIQNYTKYARDLAEVSFYNGRKMGVAWCDVFVDWCFVKAFGKAAALAITFQPTNNKNNYGAGCKYSRNYYKNNGRLFDDPQPGDQIFFYSADKKSISHTGLVYKVDNTKVYTVEGNTSGASGVIANGGGVCKKSYALTYGRIAGYGRPAWGEAVQKHPTTNAKPASSAMATKDTATALQRYVVKKNDTLWKISKRYLGKGGRYKEIMTLNGMKSTVIRAGMVLKIPRK